MKSIYPSLLESIQRAQASGELHWYLLAHDEKQSFLGRTVGPMIPCNPEAVQTQIYDIVEDLLANADTSGPIRIELVSVKHRVSTVAPRYDI